MNPERWRIVTEIFHAALESPLEQRSSYLAAACHDNPSLRVDVDALLAGDAQSRAGDDPLVTFHPAVSPGTVLGPYRVDLLLDAGGMGEVYRAFDARLKRDVAIKVLPARASADRDRLARFEREAHATAALNHPNICAVFDIGMHDGAPFIVSELLEGETLRQVCAAGPLTVRRALEYAVPIARGLAAAHVKGIVHRDLKPENVFITTEARVKILDFGLAKLMTGLAGETHLAAARALTEVGLVVGTVGYMSPEQVRGLPTDSRSDIFSFGTVLFEMLGGRPPFRGDTTADILSAILHEDPPALTPEDGVPPALERIVRRCLEKSSASRFQSAEDLAFALEAVTATPKSSATSAVEAPKRHAGRFLPVITSGLAAAAVALMAVWYATPPGADYGAYRFTPFATDAGEKGHAVWSPDGRSIAYDMIVNRRSQIFVRSLDSDSPAQLTHGSNDASRPFWYPDASRVGFVSAGEVWTVSRAGGDPGLVQGGWVVAATLSPDGQTLATWRTDVDAPGTRPTARQGHTFSVWLASPPDAAPREYRPAPFAVKIWLAPTYLQFSPDGRQLLLADWNDAADSAIWLLPFPDGGTQPHRIVPRVPTTRSPIVPTLAWMPDSRRAVMEFRTASAPGGGLWMTDTRTGTATPVSTGLMPQRSPSVSPDGSKVVFTAGGAGFDLIDVPLDGAPARDFLATDMNEYAGSWVPGSSKYVYVTNRNGDEELRIHSQTEDWDRLIVAARSFGATTDLSSPVTSPDGQRVAYDVWGASGESGASIWISPVGGGVPTKLTRAGATEGAPEWSPDGRAIACHHWENGVTSLAIVGVGTSDAPRVLAHGILETPPAWSPDGEWIAYRTEDAVRVVSPDGARHRVIATGTGGALVWARDGRTLYSARRTDDRVPQLIAIDVLSGSVRVVSALSADVYFGAPIQTGIRFTLAPDGKSFMGTIVRTHTDLWILDNFAPRGRVLDWFQRRQ